jgi:predicted site-specific integrase-resolvase
MNATFPFNDSPVWTVGTKTDASEFLKIKPRTLDDWMKKHRVPYYKLPSGAVRFRRDQLLEFLGKFEVAA